MTGQDAAWEFVQAPPRSVPGAVSAVGYRARGAAEGVHRGLPSATLTFIVALDDGVRASAAADDLGSASPARIVLGGLHRTASFVHQYSRQAGIQVALHPLATRALFGVPAAELSVTDFDAGALLGGWGEELVGRVAGAVDWRSAFTALSDRLVSRYDDRVSVRPELAHAWHLLRRTGGRIAVHALARDVGLSERHLSALFRREVGAGPKAVGDLVRFERVLTDIARGVRREVGGEGGGTGGTGGTGDEGVVAGGANADLGGGAGGAGLARIAAETGYADQAHLTRDFTRRVGIPPTAWIAEERRNIQAGGHEHGGVSRND
ncbi:MAG: helix-turn-helix domain-containing protein [Actinomycetaceae bacterium]